ncbi:MAG: alpha/beta fold hydrolase [Bacteroidetes bacterium]|nr:alpha/beta fold hydrolase [Bacteroidota bacterium]
MSFLFTYRIKLVCNPCVYYLFLSILSTKHIKLFIAVLIGFLLTSCSFNKIFLQPDKYAKGFNTLTYTTPKDTLKAYFSKGIHQPTFTKHNGRDTLVLDYTIESILFKSNNGDTINGWFLKPINAKANITILHLHGNSGSMISQYKLMTPFLKKGFQVLMFDYSGFGFSQGKATRKNALNNALSALDYLKTRSDVNDTKLIIYGQSFGGHLSPVVAQLRQNDIDALVVEGAFSSCKDIAASRVPVIGRIFVKQGYSAMRFIKKYTKPVLVIHSTEDKVIPFKMGQKLFKAANMPKEFYEVKHGHILGPFFYAEEISEKMKAMLK